MMTDAEILIVDDERAILEMLKTILHKEKFKQIDTAQTASEALRACQMKKYDLVILDVMMPDQSGFDICPMIRQTTDAPIFFLTAKTTDLDKLTGFALGADDYISKPFNPLEVVARVKAQLKRYQHHSTASQDQKIYHFGDVTVSPDSGELFVNDHPVSCPAQVFQLLLFFCQHPNQLFSKSQIYEHVWGEDSVGSDNTVMVHIRKLREKIEENPGKPRYIVTFKGLGYKLIPGGEHP